MSADIQVTGVLAGSTEKGPIGPFTLAMLLAGQRGAAQLDFEVDTADAARAIALPAEGTVQSMFLLCADQEFTFTLNGAGIVYGFKPGLVSGAGKTGFFMLLNLPFVASIEVTGGSVNAKGYLIRVTES